MELRRYRDVVLELLDRGRYPVLQRYVIVCLLYKRIVPASGETPDAVFETVSDRPEIVYEQAREPFRFVYLTGEGSKFCLYKTQPPLDADRYPVEKLVLKIHQNDVNAFFNLRCSTFEEEIYTFIAHLNFDVIRIHELLGISFVAATRFLPRLFDLWVLDYRIGCIDDACPVSRDCFGPSAAGDDTSLETRLVRGRLSPCTSRDVLLSLRDDLVWKAAPPRREPYTFHYATRWSALVPLAYNPLENPVVR